MAQSSVAREPSMDEILASIRKIIESNDPGPSIFGSMNLESHSDEEEEDDDQEIHLTIDEQRMTDDFDAAVRDSGPDLILPEEPRAEIQAQMPAPVAATTQAVTPPMSLADIAARVRAASERHAAAMPASDMAERRTEAQPAVARLADSPLMTSRMATASAPRAFNPPLADAAANRPVEPVRKVEPAVVVETAPAVVEPTPVATAVVSPSPVAHVFEAAQPVTAPVQSQPEVSEPVQAVASPMAEVVNEMATPIISAAVGQQVARSFEDLAIAVDLGPQRSFDEIAEEMLRPMLQEWLDDNLPTLVERLVREEIERVARGPRR